MSENPPTVTVIIPTYNSSGTLKLSLETVLAQDYADYEVWVVGDGCTDDSERVVTSLGDPRVYWVNLTTNSGTPSMPRNEGLRRAKGRLIAYLGHDDLWFPWHLSELVDCIEKSKSDLVASLGLLLAPDGARGVFGLPDNPTDLRGAISPSNWLHRKSLIDAIGPWATKLRLGDDRDFLRRVWAAEARVDARRQVSVLKFQSTLWKMYSIKSNFPQAQFVDAMRRDPAQLRLDLLLDLAAVMAKQPQPLQGTVPLPAPLRRMLEWALDKYGRDRWPLNEFLYSRWRAGAGLTEQTSRCSGHKNGVLARTRNQPEENGRE